MGTNWTTAYTGATNNLNAMDINANNCCPVGWAVGNGGVIVRLQLLTGIIGNNNEIPKNFTLLQNYPNPFNPSTKITYQIPVTGNVKLVIYDLLGREVKTLINEVKQPGTYLVDFDGTNFASGIYFYKLESGTFSESKKMILLK
jgi:hypothetical protein